MRTVNFRFVSLTVESHHRVNISPPVKDRTEDYSNMPIMYNHKLQNKSDPISFKMSFFPSGKQQQPRAQWEFSGFVYTDRRNVPPVTAQTPSVMVQSSTITQTFKGQVFVYQPGVVLHALPFFRAARCHYSISE